VHRGSLKLNPRSYMLPVAVQVAVAFKFFLKLRWVSHGMRLASVSTQPQHGE